MVAETKKKILQGALTVIKMQYRKLMISFINLLQKKKIS